MSKWLSLVFYNGNEATNVGGTEQLNLSIWWVNDGQCVHADSIATLTS